MEKLSLDYIFEIGLHDAILNDCTIDHESKTVLFSIGTKIETILIKLINVTLLEIDMVNDFKNQEIILDCDKLNDNDITMLTTSNTNYRIRFQKSQIWVEKRAT